MKKTLEHCSVSMDLEKVGFMQEIQMILLLNFGSVSEVAFVDIWEGSLVKAKERKFAVPIYKVLAFPWQDRSKSETWLPLLHRFSPSQTDITFMGKWIKSHECTFFRSLLNCHVWKPLAVTFSGYSHWWHCCCNHIFDFPS